MRQRARPTGCYPPALAARRKAAGYVATAERPASGTLVQSRVRPEIIVDCEQQSELEPSRDQAQAPARRRLPLGPPEADETMPREEIRTQLRHLLGSVPYGGKRPLARALGFNGRWCLHHLRSAAAGRAWIFEPERRRLSRMLMAIDRGELGIQETGLRGPGRQLFRVVRQTP